MDEKAMKKYRKKAVIWTVVITLLIVAGLGLTLGTVLPEGLAITIARWALGGIFTSCITGFIAFLFAPRVWFAKYGKDDDEVGSSYIE